MPCGIILFLQQLLSPPPSTHTTGTPPGQSTHPSSLTAPSVATPFEGSPHTPSSAAQPAQHRSNSHPNVPYSSAKCRGVPQTPGVARPSDSRRDNRPACLCLLTHLFLCGPLYPVICEVLSPTGLKTAFAPPVFPYSGGSSPLPGMPAGRVRHLTVRAAARGVSPRNQQPTPRRFSPGSRHRGFWLFRGSRCVVGVR